MDISEIKFGPDGLVPAIAQDINTSEVLMLAYMNMEALEKTLSTGRAHYWSRSREQLWLKGETSGNFQDVSAIHYDCDADTILLTVAPAGPACHTGEVSCFFRALKEGAKTRGPAEGPGILKELYNILKARKGADPDKSYVASLYGKGLPGILEKVKEESGELQEAASSKGLEDLVHETADLWFHTLVLLAYKGVEIEEVWAEFEKRFGTSGHVERASRDG
jgi:phosphoribosyl-ATP pyrophosphohydrolase/phosphoribosyl-AMP cyclohydrolase